MPSLFEFSVAFKYLVPRRKQLSVSLIALLSVAMISLVVWLVLVFLSVTEGIERGWLHKLTTLNAPLRITPTEHYYSSYYYQVDSVSAGSDYTSKTIAEKALTLQSDPYSAEEDGEIPFYLPPADRASNGALKDPVKGLFSALDGLKVTQKDLVYQDFELSGALIRLQLLRPTASGLHTQDTQSYLTQVSYLASFPSKCPDIPSLLVPPREKDLGHLLYLAQHTTDLSRQDSPALTEKVDRDILESRIQSLLTHAVVHQLKPSYPLWQIPFAFLPEEEVLEGEPHFHNGQISRIDVPLQKTLKKEENIRFWRKGDALYTQNALGFIQQLSSPPPLVVEGPVHLDVSGTTSMAPLRFAIKSLLQNVLLQGEVGLQQLEIAKAELRDDGNSPWMSEKAETLPVSEEGEMGVLLAKSYMDSGIMLGDRGYLSYSSSTTSSLQEQRLPIFVAGFYDPGMFSIGNKCVLVPPSVTRAINASSSSFHLDRTESNGLLVWFKDLKQTEKVQQQIIKALEDQGLDKYWTVTSFRQYPFAKDLLQQFQSDKYLFAMVGVLILIVACCNIISMLVLLVNDKKKEIGIFQAMGAQRLSIAAIFGICGISMGILSSIIGVGAALLTLHHIEGVIEFFGARFLAGPLPHTLSANATWFVLIATPLLSLLAGLIPAFKACRLKPSDILRSQ